MSRDSWFGMGNDNSGWVLLMVYTLYDIDVSEYLMFNAQPYSLGLITAIMLGNRILIFVSIINCVHY